jgi:hypothetical protein
MKVHELHVPLKAPSIAASVVGEALLPARARRVVWHQGPGRGAARGGKRYFEGGQLPLVRRLRSQARLSQCESRRYTVVNVGGFEPL